MDSYEVRQDDEEMVLDVDKRVLERMGYRVLRARTGIEAMDINSKNKDDMDIVILDVVMPEMGGGDPMTG
jgi:two-component system cell cycle sensor histidine kinase/response regulator CckA